MDEHDFQDYMKCEMSKIDNKIDKLFAKYDTANEKIIRNDEKINIIWFFLFGGFSLTAIMTIVLKFVVK